MVPAVLKLTIGGSAGSYRVSAEVGDKRGSDDLAPLPENLRGNLESLQEAILRTTESLRDRSRSRGRPIESSVCSSR